MRPAWCSALKICAALPISRTSRSTTMPSHEPRPLSPAPAAFRPMNPAPLAPVRSIAVTGGKGGGGQTNLAVNLASALSALGKRTRLLDADLGLANVAGLLGMSPQRTLADLVAGRCELEHVILEGPNGMLVVPAASGRRHMAELQPAQHVGLVNV